ncbi:hypothetical protein HZH68_013970 [Vespula germanica]|uniref:Uncharacterized protein n=1 Tax=Vespula germanica TaxID=30212 RepID=A0A834JCK6_VESGE|nr:hypothetical protein HZH68_013970 [Vespula germanica]
MKNLESYIKIDMMSLDFKIINKCYEQIAEIAVNAILIVYDHVTWNINFELIRIEGKVDGKYCISDILNYSQGNGLREDLVDALCIVHNILNKDKKILYGGGAVGISYKLVCSTEAKAINTSEQYTFHAFVEVLKAAQMALVENSGIDCLNYDTADMKV